MFTTEYFIIEAMDTIEGTIHAYSASGSSSVYAFECEDNPLYRMFTQLNIVLHRLSDGAKIKDERLFRVKLDKARKRAEQLLQQLDTTENKAHSFY